MARLGERRRNSPSRADGGRAKTVGQVVAAVIVVVIALVLAAAYTGLISNLQATSDLEAQLARTPDPNTPIVLDDSREAALAKALPDTADTTDTRSAIEELAAKAKVSLASVSAGAPVAAGSGIIATPWTISGQANEQQLLALTDLLDSQARLDDKRRELLIGEVPLTAVITRIEMRSDSKTKLFSINLNTYSRG